MTIPAKFYYVLVAVAAMIACLVIAAMTQPASAYEVSQCQYLETWWSGLHIMEQDYGSAVKGTQITSYGKLYLCPDGVNHLLTDWGLIPEWMMRFIDPQG